MTVEVLTAMLLTCDYRLHAFDVSTSRSAHEPHQPATVLPNVLWQVLRPFILASPDFDRSFVETFAIPEFRTLDTGTSGHDAAHHALYLLATYSNLSEQTAMRILSNDLLLDKLKNADDESAAREQLELAILTDNDVLLEERAELKRQLEEQRKAEAERRVEEKREQEQLAIALRAHQAQKQQAEERLRALERRQSEAEELVARERAAVQHEKAAQEGQIKNAQAQIAQLRQHLTVSVAVLADVVCFVILEWLVRTVGWDWLLHHPNSVRLQVGFAGLLICGTLMWAVPSHRKELLYAVAIPGLIVVLSLLGR